MNVHSILTDQTLSQMHSLSWKQVNDLQHIPGLLDNFSRVETLSNSDQNDLIQLCLRLRKLERSVDNYRPGWWIIIDFLIGRWCKVRRLQRTLPAVMQSIEALVDKILKVHPQHQETLRSLVYRKIQVVERAYASFRADQNQKNNAFTVIKVFRSLVNDVKKEILIANQVDALFQKMLRLQNKGIDVPLPDWCHATGKHENISPLRSIVKDKQIKVGVGPFLAQGNGAYFSSHDEHGNGSNQYGDFTICFDDQAVRENRATFADGSFHWESLKSCTSLWVCVKADVPISKHTVSYITTSADKIEKVKKEMSLLNCKIPVIDRDCSNLLRHYFQNTSVQNLSDRWKPFQEHAYTQIPDWFPEQMKFSTPFWNWEGKKIRELAALESS